MRQMCTRDVESEGMHDRPVNVLEWRGPSATSGDVVVIAMPIKELGVLPHIPIQPIVPIMEARRKRYRSVLLREYR